MAKNYYDVLGVSKTATADQIKSAYRNLALKHHPDRNKDKNSEEKFKEINEAFAVLSDPQKRKQYDTFGPDGFNQRFTQEDIFRNFNIEDILKNMGFSFGFGEGDDLFGGNPFSSTFSEPAEQKGVNLYLDFNDIEKGMEKEFEVVRYKRCDNCGGTGGDPESKQLRCTTCNGSGRTRISQRTPFGVFDAITVCNRCGGRGKIYEKMCAVCKGHGGMNVKEKFKVKVEGSSGKEKGDKSQRGWFG